MKFFKFKRSKALKYILNLLGNSSEFKRHCTGTEIEFYVHSDRTPILSP